MQADFDLMFDNAILFNGEGSWVIKHVQALRAFLDKKYTSCAARARSAGSARPFHTAGRARVRARQVRRCRRRDAEAPVRIGFGRHD